VNKKVWDTIKLGLVLTVYAAAACVGLAFVYGKTKAVINGQEEVNLKAAILELFPTADGFDDITGTIESPDTAVTFESEYGISRGGKVIGAVIEASAGSYGGPIKVLVGVSDNGTISRIKIMSHSDTPGLGANAAKDTYFVDKDTQTTFYGQFAGKAVTDPLEPKNDIIAVTASTITSNAVARAVRVAGRAAAGWLATEGAGQ